MANRNAILYIRSKTGHRKPPNGLRTFPLARTTNCSGMKAPYPVWRRLASTSP